MFRLVDALKVLGRDQLIEAARFYRSHQSAATLPRKTVPAVEVFTPEEMREILAQAEPEAIPALVIGAFAGGRGAWAD